MRPISARAAGVVQSSHRLRWRVGIVTNWRTGVTPTLLYASRPGLMGGSLKFEAGASGFTCEIPASWWGFILHNGMELFVEAGIDLGGGTTEWVSQGYFRVKSVTQDSAPFGNLTVECDDRWAQMYDSSSYYPFVVPATATLAQYVSGCMKGDQVWTQFNNGAFGIAPGNIVVQWNTARSTEPLGYEIPLIEDTYGEQLDRLFTERGLTADFDYRGVLVIQEKTIPDFRDPVLTITGGVGGTLLNHRRQTSREGVYNAAFVTTSSSTGNVAPSWSYYHFTGSDAPSIGSTTNFGFSRFDFTTPLSQTLSTLGEMAKTAVFRGPRGVPVTTEVQIVPNPALVVGDVFRLVYPRRRLSGTDSAINRGDDTIAEVHVIDSIAYGLDGDSAKLTTTSELVV